MLCDVGFAAFGRWCFELRDNCSSLWWVSVERWNESGEGRLDGRDGGFATDEVELELCGGDFQLQVATVGWLLKVDFAVTGGACCNTGAWG